MAGPNRWGASTDGQWLRAEADNFRRIDCDVVIVEMPDGRQALCYRRSAIVSDRVVYPPPAGAAVSNP